MDVTGLQIGIDLIVSLVMGGLGALGAWFKLKGKQDLQQKDIEGLQSKLTDDSDRFEDEIRKLRDDKKTLNATLHDRVDSLKKIVERNRERSENTVNEIKSEMNKMELRIIQAIHEIKNK